MQSSEARSQLDPLQVLLTIPPEWALTSRKFDLAAFLASIFERQEVQEENSHFLRSVTEVDCLETELELYEAKGAYLIIKEENLCKVCMAKLGHQKIRIYPHGMAFHMKCAPNPSECPVTKQRFDFDSILDLKRDDLGDL
jgi:hypothetical protein